MSLKVAVAVCFAVIAIDAALGAPRGYHNEEELKESFLEFLQQDKELGALLKSGDFENLQALSRNVRQAEEEEMTPGEEGDDQAKPGFFDRAAKFVMEVLQRFLKWINADN